MIKYKLIDTIKVDNKIGRVIAFIWAESYDKALTKIKRFFAVGPIYKYGFGFYEVNHCRIYSEYNPDHMELVFIEIFRDL